MKTRATITRTRRSVRGGGFTLAEVLAVMVIASILAAAAIPALSDQGPARTATAGKILLHDLTFARQRAIATGTVSWVLIDPATESWTIEVEDPANPGKANAAALTDPATNAAYGQTLGTGDFVGVEIVSSAFAAQTDVGFDWKGRPLTADSTLLAATGTVTLNDGYTVTVEKETGLATYTSP